MQKLNEDELRLVQREEGERNAVHDGREKHAEEEAKENRALTH